jgi:uncharacterized membrane protein YcaP (DUF421 family)
MAERPAQTTMSERAPVAMTAGDDDVDEFLFSGWGPLLKTLLAALLAYPILILVLRISGKRTLAQMNAFDFIVTVALGSTLASVLISNSVSIIQGIEALVLLIALQYCVAWASIRWQSARHMVKSQPRLLVHNGRVLRRALADERLAESEVLQALRQQGVADLSAVRAVVLETNGRFSVVGRSDDASGALQNVVGWVPDGTKPDK